jgi:hypothetical protein
MKYSGVHVNLNRGNTSLTKIGTPRIHKEAKEGGTDDEEPFVCDGEGGGLIGTGSYNDAGIC